MLPEAMKDGQFRHRAANLAKFLKDPAALARFLEIAKGTDDESTRGAALQASAVMGGPGVFEAASELLRNSRPGGILCANAASALGTLGTMEAAHTLVDMLRGSVGTPLVSMYADALSQVRSPEALAEIGRLANDDDQVSRLPEQMVTALGRTKDPAVVPDLMKIASQPRSEEARDAARRALGLVGAADRAEQSIDDH